jgi:hypothetical protein
MAKKRNIDIQTAFFRKVEDTFVTRWRQKRQKVIVPAKKNRRINPKTFAVKK